MKATAQTLQSPCNSAFSRNMLVKRVLPKIIYESSDFKAGLCEDCRNFSDYTRLDVDGLCRCEICFRGENKSVQ